MGALVTGVFGLLIAAVGQLEVLRRGLGRRSRRDQSAHIDMADTLETLKSDMGDQLDALKDDLKTTRRDIGGMRSEVRGVAARVTNLGNRVTHLDERLDRHLDR